MHLSRFVLTGLASLFLANSASADMARYSNGLPVMEVAQKSKTTSLRRAYRTGAILKKRKYPKTLIARARRSDDEIDECMKNPSNSNIPYIERLGACFCLAINNATEGCQSAD